jgi:hypothetical protein
VVWIINQRTQDIDGGIARPEVLESQGGAHPTYRPVRGGAVAAATAGRQVILAIHGFNVSRPKAVRSYVTLEQDLRLTGEQVFFGVAWPGDAWIPVVNYPWEAGDAVACGDALARYLLTAMPDAAGYHLVSHSLGGRVLLEALKRLGRRAGQVCITAGAVDSDCLATAYAPVKGKADRISVLASKKDKVLWAAYPLGDFVSDVLLGDRDSPWRGALGRRGPQPLEGAPVIHRQIPGGAGYDHGDFFPPGDGGTAAGRWTRAVAYMRRALNGEPDAPL